MTGWRTYPSYSESGIDWLQKIPTHWQVVRSDGVTECVRDTIDPDLLEGSVFHYSIPVIEEIGDGQVEPVAEINSSKLLLEGGELLVSKLNPRKSRVLLTEEHEERILCSSEFVVLKPNGAVPRYLLHLYSSEYARQHLSAQVRSATRSHQRVTPDAISKMWLPLPPLSEQREIADFLDRKTAEIDALVAKQERLIELLEERRAALISHAVTKGLDPDVEMKDSGIPWLGEIPRHWDVTKIRRVAKLESGHTPSRQHPEYWEDCYIPWFSLADVWQIRDDRRLYISETKELVSELGLANSSARLLPKGSVVLSRTASVGFSGIMACPMATTQDFANWICGEHLIPEYLLFTFRAMRQELDRFTMGSTHQTIYMPDIAELSMVLPPIEEQTRIVEVIQEESTTLYALTDHVRSAINRLHEYRTALISAAVTGKIDVREQVK